VQFGQVVARHGGVHVVFGVVVHLPIEEADERVQVDRAGTQAEIKKN
jgi:drug/metabolite transporter superfamily protein YnfA